MSLCFCGKPNSSKSKNQELIHKIQKETRFSINEAKELKQRSDRFRHCPLSSFLSKCASPLSIFPPDTSSSAQLSSYPPRHCQTPGPAAIRQAGFRPALYEGHCPGGNNQESTLSRALSSSGLEELGEERRGEPRSSQLFSFLAKLAGRC